MFWNKKRSYADRVIDGFMTKLFDDNNAWVNNGQALVFKDDEENIRYTFRIKDTVSVVGHGEIEYTKVHLSIDTFTLSHAGLSRKQRKRLIEAFQRKEAELAMKKMFKNQPLLLGHG